MAKKNFTASSDVYTAILALASLTVLSTAVFVAVKCSSFYGTLFSIAQAAR
jgi:hypothetical protein